METLSVMLGLLCGLLGAGVTFLAIFAARTGFKTASILYAVQGISLLVAAYGLGTPPLILLLLLAVSLGAFLAFYLLTIPCIRLLPKEGRVSMHGVTTIEDAVRACQESKLVGWELVAYAQQLAANRFAYSRRNPWDSPSKAFERGMGYCQQQALALKEIYDGLGVDSKLVYANHCRFPPPAEVDESLALVRNNRWMKAWFRGQENVFGHTWLRVHVGEEKLDVCPDHPANRPGAAHFEPLSDVKTLYLWLQPLTHLGSAIGNLMLERQARRLSLREAA